MFCRSRSGMRQKPAHAKSGFYEQLRQSRSDTWTAGKNGQQPSTISAHGTARFRRPISEWNATKKDQIEIVIYRMVCEGKLTLSEAQKEMAEDWISAWKKYVPSHKKYRFRTYVD
jgi:hypothetical protein